MFYDKPWFLGGLCKGKGVIRILNLTFGVAFFDLTIIWGYDFINYNWLVNKFVSLQPIEIFTRPIKLHGKGYCMARIRSFE
jgi:hypothetical protein